jgi:hypothetical protein
VTLLEAEAAECGLVAVAVLDDLRTRSGGWFTCECSRCRREGDDCHAWDVFEANALNAIQTGSLALAEREALAMVNGNWRLNR